MGKDGLEATTVLQECPYGDYTVIISCDTALVEAKMDIDDPAKRCSSPRSTILHSVRVVGLLGVRASARSSQTLLCVEGGQVLRGDKGTNLVCSVCCVAPIVACLVSGACFTQKVTRFCRAARRCGTLQTLSGGRQDEEPVCTVVLLCR